MKIQKLISDYKPVIVNFNIKNKTHKHKYFSPEKEMIVIKYRVSEVYTQIPFEKLPYLRTYCDFHFNEAMPDDIKQLIQKLMLQTLN